MKKGLATAMLCGIALVSYSQLTSFFPDSNVCFSVSQYKFWFHGDTAIEGLRYKKVLWQVGDSLPNLQRATYFSAVREDTVNGKVYCIQKDDVVERLLYNFSLSEGDTASVYSFWPFGTPLKKYITARSVDTVQIDGQYRKRITIYNEHQGGDRPELWIEGIGSTFGPFYPAAFGVSDVGTPCLLCIHKGSEILLQLFDYCYENIFVSINENAQPLSSFNVYPNPATSIINLTGEEHLGEQYRYCIFNSLGSAVKKGAMLSYSIDISILKNGLYLIVLYHNGNPLRYSKFLKN